MVKRSNLQWTYTKLKDKIQKRLCRKIVKVQGTSPCGDGELWWLAVLTTRPSEGARVESCIPRPSEGARVESCIRPALCCMCCWSCRSSFSWSWSSPVFFSSIFPWSDSTFLHKTVTYNEIFGIKTIYCWTCMLSED